ncbi:hypothetical protein, partial [Salmonella sp. s57936]|uniref:hypothetical protein n=1 Tax=Salmonella sp. s57936 TaxID=3159698 RepID=UPI003980CD55
MSLEEQIVFLDSPPSLVAAVSPVDVESKSITLSSPAVIADINVKQDSLSSSSTAVIADAPVGVEVKSSLHPALPIAVTPQVLDPEPE